MKLISIVIRTLNEEKHLPELLSSIHEQKLDDGVKLEVVIIDSGSTDRTLQIAKQHDCRVTHIQKEDFTFGRSLNEGSAFARGDVLVYISGHCIPVDGEWLMKLVTPLREGISAYSYGRQVGRDSTKYSERKLFQKYFPEIPRPPTSDFFCNNANAALSRPLWASYRFDEEILGLEDMELAKRLSQDGEKISYVADAAVFHIHDEVWTQTRRRYEREAIALQKIMPDVHVSLFNTLHYFLASVVTDSKSALQEKCFWEEFFGIVKFRLAQYWGAYRGNHEHRKLSQKRKYNYYYPNKIIGD
jgi:glycosyltransferase involved in cell wall biosynthesis